MVYILWELFLFDRGAVEEDYLTDHCSSITVSLCHCQTEKEKKKGKVPIVHIPSLFPSLVVISLSDEGTIGAETLRINKRGKETITH